MRSPRQLRALESPVGLEIIEALQVGGPSTIAELAERIGRAPDSLYYHLRKLLDAGLVTRAGQRPAGKRTAAVFDLVAGSFATEDSPASPRARESTARAVGAVLRLAERDLRAAMESGEAVSKGRGRNLHVGRRKAWLGPAELAKANRLLGELDRLFSGGSRPGKGQLVAWTGVLTPVRLKGAARRGVRVRDVGKTRGARRGER